MKYFPIEVERVKSSNKLNIPTPPPLSLYIHYPWCIKKCPYCDFNSHTITQSIEHDEKIYLESIILDLQQQLPLIWGRAVNTIFIGGGTPNLISPQGMHYLMNQLRALLRLQPHAEITMEANPGILSKDRFEAYYDAGINRVSIGIQSLNNHHLHTLGRIHNQSEALHTLDVARTIFNNINADLMYGLPQQTIKEAQYDIEKIIQSGIPHISAYQLTIEPNTWFYHQPPKIPSEEKLTDIEQIIHTTLDKYQYKRYEISAFSQPNFQCQHNLNYWYFGDYLGIGAGAHGKLTFHDKIIRTQHKKNPKSYIRSIKEQNFISNFQITIPQEDLASEFMMNALRLIDGFELKLYTQRTGLNLTSIQQPLLSAQSKNLITIKNNSLKPTSLGINFLNNLIELFFDNE
ncbi:MAG: oxygen-independent coproporphyrinogen III oxidase-like protein [Neisseriaceae bacterium]|nr:MAG: oxygen-independent coproporphyrinogen III oxidase-like protein [Neisseriaceae bacterium]